MPKSHTSVLKRVSGYRNYITALLLVTFLALGFLAAPRSLTSVLTPVDAAATELFISEIIEGSSNNKAIEIYNGTGSAIDLAAGGYNIQMFFNGNPVSTLTINLIGTVADGDVFVLAQAAANPAILAQADQTNGSGWFNGDDAVVLRKGSVVIDSLGQIGVDPGAEWGTGLASTADNTLRRKSALCAGDTNGNDAFDPAAEWDGFPIDTVDGLGSHTAVCGGGTPTPTPTATPTPTPTATPTPTPAPFKAIHEIQGSGTASPHVGQDVMTTGIVTAKKSNGFFLQTSDAEADADPDTSQGIFVFTGGAPTVNVGEAVNATGGVVEFNNLTELSIGATGIIQLLSPGNPLPSPVTLTAAILDPAGPVDQLERFEGMRVHAASLRSVAPTNEFGETFTVIDGVARPFREPGIEISLPVPPDPISGVADCCIPRWDENPERIMIDSDGLAGSTRVSVTSNVVFSNVVGPLDFNFDDYKIVPESTPATSANMTAVPVPAPGAGEFTVAGFNIENYTGGTTQRLKAALAIRDVMRLPDIIGHVEIRNEADLQALADQVNADTVAAGGPDPQYVARLIPFSAAGTQNVGFLVKTSRIRVDSVNQERAGDTFIDPSDSSVDLVHDRPPLVLKATVDPSSGNPRQVIVVVNHLRSFISIEGLDATGIRVREKRRAQAESLARLLDELQTNNPDTPVISVGDYNAYEFSDGYTDPIATIKGIPTNDDDVVVEGSPDLIDPDFVNLMDGLPQNERYSFTFEGTPQALDHVIVNQAAGSMLQNFAVARNNADFPDVLTFSGDAMRPERASDHDMPVAYFKFPQRATTTTVSNVNVTYDVNGQNVLLTANVSADINTVSEGTVTFTVTDGGGATVGTTAPAGVSSGAATANFPLPGSVLPQALTITANFSGGDTALPSTGTGTLNVGYAVCGSYDPLKAVKSGATYPIKLQLCDVSALNVSNAGVTVRATSVQLVSAPDTDIEVTDAGNANPDNNFRFDADLNGYIFNLKTTGLSSGVYRLYFTAGDDRVVHSVEFRVK